MVQHIEIPTNTTNIELRQTHAAGSSNIQASSSSPLQPRDGGESPTILPQDAPTTEGSAIYKKKTDAEYAHLQEIASTGATANGGKPSAEYLTLLKSAMTERTADPRLADIYCEVSKTRPIDLDALCTWINDHLAPVLTAGSGDLKDATVKKFIADTSKHSDAFFGANYFAPFKGEIKRNVEKSGGPYPAPQFIGTISQYIVPAFASVGNTAAGFAVGLFAGLTTWFPQSLLQQRAAVIPSELIQKRGSTFLKTAGKYDAMRGDQAKITQGYKTQFIDAADSVRADPNIVDTSMLHDHPELKNDLVEAFSGADGHEISASLKGKLEDMKVASKEARTAIIDQMKAALSHTRQELGAKRQTWLKIFRPAATTIPTLLRHPLIAKKMAEKNLPELTKAYAALGTAGIALTFQVIQHFLAKGDEWSKVEMKVALNMLCAQDYLTKAGVEAMWRGEPVLPEHIVVEKFRSYASGPCQTIASEVKTVVSDQRKELQKVGDETLNPEIESFQRQIDALGDGDISSLQSGDFASKLFNNEMKSHWGAMHYFQCNLLPDRLERMFADTNYLLYHQSDKRSNDPDDKRSQYIQKGSAAALHGYGLASSTMSQNIAKIPVVAAKAGIEDVSMALLGSMLVTSAVIGGVNAYGSAETQTAKNVNKSKDAARKKGEAQAVAGSEAQVGTGQSRMDRMKENFDRMNQGAKSFYGFVAGSIQSETAIKDMKVALTANLDLESSLQEMIDTVDNAMAIAEMPALSQIKTVSSEGSQQGNVAPEASHQA